jgi:hypothetical protein
MKRLFFPFIGIFVLATGCARFNSTVTERTLPDGSRNALNHWHARPPALHGKQ